MDTIKELTKDELIEIISIRGFPQLLSLKDYYIIILLYILKDIKGIYFKGGTALQLTILNYSRLSEDIDFTITREIDLLIFEIKSEINKSNFFEKIIYENKNNDFVRLVVFYKNELADGKIYIDLNRKAKLFLLPNKIKLNHYYKNIPEFEFYCLDIKEMVAEKIEAAIARNKPRDHYDIYQIIKKNIEIDFELVEKKCLSSGVKFDIIRMFNRANRLHNKWKVDLIPLLRNDVNFIEVMKTIYDYFNIKGYKLVKKNNKIR
ncbi:MAG: nucleotidyl transferase AbiEii/AbiGii toxin family protein [Candidatus Nanoarchaeia archaeon]|nr:nucleotidyl transferase AbiEii/AbiGii toxin family protein [Candidatus Nanoarchaeia archaeon]